MSTSTDQKAYKQETQVELQFCRGGGNSSEGDGEALAVEQALTCAVSSVVGILCGRFLDVLDCAC